MPSLTNFGTRVGSIGLYKYDEVRDTATKAGRIKQTFTSMTKTMAHRHKVPPKNAAKASREGLP